MDGVDRDEAYGAEGGDDYEQRVLVDLGWADKELRRLMLSGGGQWIGEKRLWELPMGLVLEFGLEGKLVEQ